MLGQIATFMDTLHLSYRETVYEIPYRNLIIMQRDKLHVCTGKKLVEVTDDVMFGRFIRKKDDAKKEE